MNFKKSLYSHSRRNFSARITSERERRLNQFFKLPKSKLEFQEKVYDRPDEDYSVLRSINDQEADKLDIMDKIIRKKKLDSEQNINKFFENSSSTETMKITENLVERMRMNKEFKFTEEFKQKEILNEYGNYDKYFKNYKVTNEKEYGSEDDGENNWEARYQELQEKYKNPGTRHTWEAQKKSLEDKIREDVNTYGADYTFQDYLSEKQRDEQFNQKNNLSTTNPRTKEMLDDVKRTDKELGVRPFREITYDHRTRKEKDAEKRAKLFDQVARELERAGFEDYNSLSPELEDQIEKESKKIVGRVSPWCKEEIYRSYLEGWTVKDLSYKYGLLPERVKVIVWMRDLFWREIYPKIGETGLRIRMEEGLRYAKRFAYIDYGKDLQHMAEREQGVFLQKIRRSEIDCRPSKEVEEKISPVIRNIKPRAIDKIPVKFHGKGCSGYLIKDMVCRRGLGSKRVSFMFQKFCMYKDLHPHVLPEKVLVRKDLGPRLATLGYKF
jgi:hypothetical protein